MSKLTPEQILKSELAAFGANADLDYLIEQFARDIPNMEKMERYLAVQDRLKYRALIEAGFSEQQAIALVKRP